MDIMGSGFYPFSIMIAIVMFSIILFLLFKMQKARRLHFSLLLVDIFLILRLIISLLNESMPKLHLYLHVASLLLISFALIRIALKVCVDYFLESMQGVSIPKILQDLIQIGAFILIGLIILHEYFSLDTSILVTSSVLSIVIGLALQDTLGNFFSGMALQMQKPFDKGDWIMADDQIGQVTDIDWRAIKIRTLDRDNYVIPNSEIAKSSFVNYSKPTRLHRIVIPMGVHYKDPPNFVKKVMMDVIEEEIEEKQILRNPAPTIMLVKYNDFSIDYEIRIFTDKFHLFKEITDRFYVKLWYQFKRNNIVIPFPIRDVYMHEVKVEDELEVRNKILNTLKKVDFLTVLSEEELEKLASGVNIVNFAANETVIRQGDSGNSFYIITKGFVEVLHTDDDGNVQAIKKLTSPSFFGELSLLTGSDRTATILTLTDCDFITVKTDTFKGIIMSNPELANEISNIIVSRQMELDKMHESQEEKDFESEREEKSRTLLGRMKEFFGLRS